MARARCWPPASGDPAPGRQPGDENVQPDLMMTGFGGLLLSEPNPWRARHDFVQANETWMGFRAFSIMSGRPPPCTGPDPDRPFQPVQHLGPGRHLPAAEGDDAGRAGFPATPFPIPTAFCTQSNRKVFVEGECDFVSSIGL